MIKKLFLIMILILCLSGCGKYEGWKEIEMENIGSIKIPEEWTCHIEGEKIYFTDEGVKELSEENVHLAGYIYDEHYIIAAQKMFDENASYEDTIESQVYSNDTYRGIDKYYVHGKWCEKGYIRLGFSEQDKEIFLIAWDDKVAYDDLEKIAKSFDGKTLEELEKANSK